jgi:hypothetical protein
VSTSEQILKSEFDAEDGSFLLIVRCELRWDIEAFRRLTSAMYDMATKLKGSEVIPTWIANGFWYCDTWVRDWTSHRNFPRPQTDYYDSSLQLLRDLACFLFFGESPYEDDTLEKSAKG